MIRRWSKPTSPLLMTPLTVDHIGVVVRDLPGEVARWRALGFTVSDPVPLMRRDDTGRAIPLGQCSAHVVFENGYVELSSPNQGSNNHLLPYLALGEGVRILVLATEDADAAWRQCAARWPQLTPAANASRSVVIADEAHTAQFRWFPLPVDVVPGTLSAIVQHLTPELVFHPSLVDHANGARRITRFIATGRPGDLDTPTDEVKRVDDLQRLDLISAEARLAISGLAFSGSLHGEETFFSLHNLS